MTDVRTVSLDEALELIDDGAILLDVREAHEWARGRYEGARSIPLAEVPESLEQLPHDHTIVCVCRSGGRSRIGARFLSEHDFDVVNLEGGMLDWVKAGEAIVADDGAPSII